MDAYDLELYYHPRLPKADCSAGPSAELMRRERVQEWWRIAAEPQLEFDAEATA